MRVLAVTDAERWFNYHIVGSLSDLGHEVHSFVYGAGAGDFYGWARRSERFAKNQELVDLATRLKSDGGLDLIFCFVYDDFLSVEHARRLAELGVPMVNFNVDMTNQWYRQILTGQYFTYVLCAQRINMDSMTKHGLRTVYFPMAARPKPVDNENFDFLASAPVTFVGSPMPYRIKVLVALAQAGVPLAVYGAHWQQNRHVEPERSIARTLSDIYHYLGPRLRAEGPGGLVEAAKERFQTKRNGEIGNANASLPDAIKGGAVPDSALDLLFHRSSINLGFTRMVGSELGVKGKNQVKLRDFEVPLAGGFYLVEEAPDHAELYHIGKEVETWRTLGELIEKIQYYLEHETERTRIASAGQQRALRDHTWPRRFEMLFNKLGIG